MPVYLTDTSTLVDLFKAGGGALIRAYVGSRNVTITDVILGENTTNLNYPKDALINELVQQGKISVLDTKVGLDRASGADTASGAGERSMAEVMNDPRYAGTDFVPVSGDVKFNWNDNPSGRVDPSRIRGGADIVNDLRSDGTITSEQYAQARDGFLNGNVKDASSMQTDEQLGIIREVPPTQGETGGARAEPAPERGSSPLSDLVETGRSLLGNNRGTVSAEAAIEGAGAVLGAVGGAVIAMDIANSTMTAILQAESGNTAAAAQTMTELGGRVSGALIGAEAGAGVGAELGLPLGPAGAAIGALLGGVAGALVGGLLGQGVAEALFNAASDALGILGAAIGGVNPSQTGGPGVVGPHPPGGLLGALIGPFLSGPIGGAFARAAAGMMGSAQHDPLVIDLSGKGINLIDRSAGSPYFDLRGDGVARNMGWVGKGTGFLALVGDDGLVHDGRQLFGTSGQDGFAALRALDANGDGVINVQDPAYAKLVVWQDLDGDGVFRAGEVSTLAQLGILGISLHTSATSQYIGNATITETASAIMADGSTREVAEANLDVSATDTRYVGHYTLDPAVVALPNLKGYGRLPDLWIAMSQDSQLKDLVLQLVQAPPSSTADLDVAVQGILLRWAEAENATAESGGTFDGPKLAFLRTILNNDGKFGSAIGVAAPVFWIQANQLQASWDAVFTGLKARLLVQMESMPFHHDFRVDPGTDLLVPRTGLHDSTLDLSLYAPADEPEKLAFWVNALTVISTSVADLNQYVSIAAGQIATDLQAVTPAYLSPDILAAAASGTLSFVEGAPVHGYLVGTGGADLITVFSPDTIVYGQGGGDEVVLGAGLGRVEIDETALSAGERNVLLLGPGVDPATLTAHGDTYGNLFLTLADGAEVQLDGMLGAPGTRGVQEVRFLDGTVWTAQQVVQLELSAATNTGSTLYGTPGADLLDGQGAKHILQGGGGGDAFVFNAGYGQLRIDEADADPAAHNVLLLGPGILPAEVSVIGSGGDAVLRFAGVAADQVVLGNMLASSRVGLQEVRFADGTAWTAQQVRVKALTGSLGNTELHSYLGQVTLDPAGYAHRVSSNGGNTTVLFDAGYGRVEVDQRDYSPQGDNVLLFGPGILPGQVAVGTDHQGNVVLTVGSGGDQVVLDGMLLGPANGVQTVRFADGTAWTAQGIVSQIPEADRGVSPNGYFTEYALASGMGVVTVTAGGRGAVRLGAGLLVADVLVQTDAAGDLVLRLRGNQSDVLTIQGSLYRNYGTPMSRISEVTDAAGGRIDLATAFPGFTWTAGSGSGATLAGSGLAANTFELPSGGGATVVLGHGQDGAVANTVVFDRGNGSNSIVLNGATGTVRLGPHIARSDVALQADNDGTLAIKLLGTGETLTVQGDLAQGWWGGVTSGITGLAFADGTTLAVGHPTFYQGQDLAFTWVGTGDGARMVGSDYGANSFIVGPNGADIQAGNASLGGSGQNSFLYDRGDGHAIVDMNGGWGTLRLAAGIAASEVLLQADDANGSLVVALRGDPADTITFKGDLSQGSWGGITSQVTSITTADGTTLAVGHPSYDRGQDLAFTWAGTAANKVLVGSGYGANVFELGEGGDTVTFGNGAKGGPNTNTVRFSRGNGHATVNTNGGWGTLQLGGGITADDLVFRTDDATGDLTVGLRGDPDDTITFKGDLTRGSWGGVTSQVSQVKFADGTGFALGQPRYDLGQPLAFTYRGTATDTVLTGSNWASNTFILGPGGDQVTAGNSSRGGSGQNSFVFHRGDGHAVVDMNGGWGTLQLGAGIALSDLLLQADDASGNLVVALRGDPADSITFRGDLSWGWWGNAAVSQVTSITTADGASLAVGHPTFYQGQDLAFTWVGTASTTSLVGSKYGANTFELGAGGDTVTWGRAAWNTVLFGHGDGQATVNPNGGTGELRFAADVALGDVQASRSGNDLVISLRGMGDSLTVRGMYAGSSAPLQKLSFADGSALVLPTLGTPGSDSLYGTGAAEAFDGLGGNDYVQGGGGGDTFLFNQGYGRLEVNEADYAPGSVNVLRFGPGITPGQVSLTGNGQNWNMTATIGSSGDTVVFDEQLLSAARGVQAITFSDGTRWGMAEILRQNGLGQPGKAVLQGFTGDDVLDPRGYAHEAWGRGGSDTYVMDRGYGDVLVHNDYNASSPHGHLAFSEAVASNQLWFARTGDDLVASVLGTGDRAVVRNWFGASFAQTVDVTAAGGAKLDGGLGQLLADMAGYQAAHPGFSPSLASAMPTDPSLQASMAAAWHN